MSRTHVIGTHLVGAFIASALAFGLASLLPNPFPVALGIGVSTAIIGRIRSRR